MNSFTEKASEVSMRLAEPERMRSFRGELAAFADASADLPYGIAIKSKGEGLFAVGEAGISYEREGDAEFSPLRDSFVEADVAATLGEALPQLKKNRFGAANAALAEGGAVIRAEKGSSALRLSSMHEADGSDIFVVIVGDGASLELSDEFPRSDMRRGRTTVVSLGEGAKLDYTLMSRGGGSLYANVVILQDRGSGAEFANLTVMKEGTAKIDVEHVLRGDGAASDTRNMSLVAGGFLDVFNSAAHAASFTRSRIHAAGVAAGDGRIIYRSDIAMRTDGTRALSGIQRAKFLSVSPKAEVDAIPMLDVGRKEVECSHSVSVSHLKESDLHYPMSRGLGRADAARLLMAGLLAPEGSGGFGRFKDEYLREIEALTI